MRLFTNAIMKIKIKKSKNQKIKNYITRQNNKNHNMSFP